MPVLQAALYEAIVGDHGGCAVVLVVRVERVGEPLPRAYVCRKTEGHTHTPNVVDVNVQELTVNSTQGEFSFVLQRERKCTTGHSYGTVYVLHDCTIMHSSLTSLCTNAIIQNTNAK